MKNQRGGKGCFREGAWCKRETSEWRQWPEPNLTELLLGGAWSSRARMMGHEGWQAGEEWGGRCAAGGCV